MYIGDLTHAVDDLQLTINCHSCGQRGHFADHCPVTTSKGVNGSGDAASECGNISFVLLQKVKRCLILKWWLLLDSQSTLDLI